MVAYLEPKNILAKRFQDLMWSELARKLGGDLEQVFHSLGRGS